MKQSLGLRHEAIAWTKRQSIGKMVKSLGWIFWPNESKSSHVIIGIIVFIIYAEIVGITSSTTK